MSDRHAQDLLFEIGTEELPARFVEPALAHLAQALPKALDELRLPHGAVTVDGTPRRLTVVVEGIAARQEDLEEEVTGPREDIAWDKGGALTKAGLGFLKGRGLDEGAAYKKETKKGVVIAARVKQIGRAAPEVLAPRLSELVAGFPFAKAMRWTDEKATFGRPVRWILALLGEDGLDVSFNGVQASTTTRGHRFHAPDPVAVKNVDEYRRALAAREVVLSVSERKRIIREEARKLAQSVGGTLREDEALLDIVGNLVEKPWPILGRFDARFLDIPKEILISEMREHQKYFAIENEDGALLPAFVIVAGSAPPDAAMVAAGHQRVLRSRFEDGAFYYREDLKTRLDERAKRLERILFQRELGTLAEKTARVKALVEALADELTVSADDRATALRAASLAKADLASGVVGEFPELQGTMGRYYALAEGESAAVATAIEEHYAPRHAGAALPSTTAGALVAIADRLDTLVGILAVGKAPTGSADPFGLRRAAIAIAHLSIGRGLAFSLSRVVARAVAGVAAKTTRDPAELTAAVLEFFGTRLRAVIGDRLDERGVEDALDIADATIAAGADDLVDLDARAGALAELRRRDAGAFQALAAAFKRTGNILNKARADKLVVDPERLDDGKLHEPAEKALLDEVRRAEAVVAGLARADVPRVLAVLVELKPAVDVFFDKVLVMADDVAVRDARLALLARIERMLTRVADFTRIQVE